MKIKLPVFLIVFFSLIFLNFRTISFSADDGLVAHYTFNTCRAIDRTGNNPEGELMGDPGCRCGVDGNALFFDGMNDYVVFPGMINRYFNTTDFTVSFYFKPGKYSIFKQSLLSKRDSCNENHMLDFQLDINGQLIKTDVYETPNKYFRDISPDLPQSDWVHFALVRKGIYAYTYINGALRREGRRCSGVDIGNEALLSFSNTPCLVTGRTVRFKGGLDELRVYDYALSEKEVAALYALHPVETAEVDCVTFNMEKELNETKSAYFCAKY